MRWITHKNRKPIDPGEVQFVKYFAFIPTKLDDGFTVWLEMYWAEQKWFVGMSEGFWETTRTFTGD